MSESAPQPRKYASTWKPAFVPPFLTPGEDWVVEHATVDDVGLIIDSWASNQFALPRWRDHDRDIFKVEFRARVMELISTCRIAVARPTPALSAKMGLPHSPKGVLAFVCYSLHKKTHYPIIHFVYTKAELRRRGIAKILLISSAGVKLNSPFFITHFSPQAKRALAGRSHYLAVVNEFLLEKHAK